MKKKNLLVVLVLAITLIVLQATVLAEGANGEMKAEEFLGKKDGNNTITLDGEVTITDENIKVTDNLTVDLNGNTIKTSVNAVFDVSDGATLTIKDNASGGKITSSAANPTIRVNEGATLIVEGGKIENTSDASTTGAIQVSDEGGKVTIKKGEVVGVNYGIAAFGKSEVIINDGKVEGKNSYGIATNGSSDSNGTKVTVNGGTITGKVAGMYLPSKDGVTTITGGIITGTAGAGIVVRGGSIEISGSPVITATGSTTQTYGDNGVELLPAALVVDNNTSYGDGVSAKVTGGTFKADASQQSVAYYSAGAEDSKDEGNNMEISGGTFKSGTKNDEKVSNYLEANLTTDDEGNVEKIEYTVTNVKDANENTANITCDVKDDAIDVVVTDDITASHSEDSEINTWWVGVGFVAPDGAEKAKYKFNEETDKDLDALESWTDGTDNIHQGLSLWVDATKEANKNFSITITWINESGKTIGEVTYNVKLSGVTMNPFEAKIVGFGYDKNGKTAREAAAENRESNGIETDENWKSNHDWGTTDNSQVMWINFKDPIPDGVTIKVDITTPNGTVETVECKGNGEYCTYAWSYTNEKQTGDINVQVGDYTLTKAEAVTDESYKGGKVEVTGFAGKTVNVEGSTEVTVYDSGFEADADKAKEAINKAWTDVKSDGTEITDVDSDTMWVMFKFDSKESCTVEILKDNEKIRTESVNDTKTKGLLVYESFNNHLKDVESKGGVYTFNFVDNNVTIASAVIEIYEVKFVIPEGLETSSNTDILTTDPESVEKPVVTGIPSGKHIEWKKVENNYELTYTASLVNDSKSSSSGSSGSSSKATVIAEKAKNGSIKLSNSNAKAGDSVKVTPKADKGYTVDKVVVTDKNGKEIKVEENEDGTYTFVMPEKSAQPVEVNVTFKAEEQKQEQEHKCSSEKYNDIDQDSWYHEAIDYVIDNELMNGTSETTFNPNDTITRAMVVTILWRLDGENKANVPATFKDVLDGTWYTEAIKWASENKIVEGYNAEEFGTNDPVTREQMAKILYNYAKYAKIDIDEGDSNLNNFADASQVSSWATESVNWAVAENLMVGSNGNLNPVNTATRAEFATIMMRYCENIVE